MGSELVMEPLSFEVVALLRSGNDLPSELSDSPFEDDLRCVRQSLGGGEAAEDAIAGRYSKKLPVPFPYNLFSSYYSLWVNWGSPGE